MPILLSAHPFKKAKFGLWQIAEPESFFRDTMPLTPEEEKDLAPLTGIRRSEWLASRYLLHLLTGSNDRMPLAKTAFAKPFFLDEPDLFCSLSHSQGVVGALLAEVECGCDIQVFVDKMPRLAPKFISADEYAFIHTHPVREQFELFHAFWTAKESLYKAYGLKQLDFRKHLYLEPFAWPDEPAITKGWVRKSPFEQQYQLMLEKYMLPDDHAVMCAICYQPHAESLILNVD